jgi:hypothetical protein
MGKKEILHEATLGRIALKENYRRRIVAGTLQTVFVMHFAKLLNWVDNQILGREVTFDRPMPAI